MKKVVCFCLLALALAAAPAMAAGPYVTLFGGNSFFDLNSPDGSESITGYLVGAAAGAGSGPLRGELEFSLRNVSVVDTDLDIWSLMVNGYYDHKVGRCTPYLGLGAGGARGETGDEHDVVFAWQLMAGVGLPVSPNLTVDFSYRYHDTEKFGGGLEYHSHNAVAGLRYNF